MLEWKDKKCKNCKYGKELLIKGYWNKVKGKHFYCDYLSMTHKRRNCEVTNFHCDRFIDTTNNKL